MVHVKVHIDAPLARVFDAVSDHESFLRTDDVRTGVVRPGEPDR